MAPVEGETYCTHSKVNTDYITVERGKSGKIDCLPDTLIGVFCNPQDNKGMALIIGDPNFTGAIMVNEDNQGNQTQEFLDIKEPIYFSGKQKVVVYSIESTEEVYLEHLDPDLTGPQRVRIKKESIPHNSPQKASITVPQNTGSSPSI